MEKESEVRFIERAYAYFDKVDALEKQVELLAVSIDKFFERVGGGSTLRDSPVLKCPVCQTSYSGIKKRVGDICDVLNENGVACPGVLESAK